MFINNNIFITIVLSIVLFIAGYQIRIRIKSDRTINRLLLISLFLALPGLSMILYYIHLSPTANWYINFRAIAGIEISISLIGLFLGLLANSKRKFVVLLIFTFLLIVVPYIKPIVRPLHMDNKTVWNENVCMQSTGATCGPSSLATIFRYFDIESTEYEISENSYSCNTGTEIWYILRYAKSKGLNFHCNSIKKIEDVKYPTIVGVKFSWVGHFVTFLGKNGNKYIVGDPLIGKLELTKQEFYSKYKLDGLMIEFEKDS